MARLLDDANLDWMSSANAIITGVPFTASIWFKTDTLAIGECILSISDSGTTANQYGLLVDGVAALGASDKLCAFVRAGGSFNLATSTATVTTGVWHHAIGSWPTTDLRKVWLDGVAGTDGIGVESPTGIDRFALGRLDDSSPNWEWSGDLAECGLWSLELDAGEIAALAAGASPLLIRPASLLAYWTVSGRTSPEIDLIGNFDLSLNSGTVASTHPRIIQPTGQILQFPPVAGTSASITGTATSSITESDVVTGGKTIIITLTGDTWKAAGTGPIGSTADTQAIIDGLDSAQAEATGWNAEVRDKEVTTAVVRTSATIATITLTAAAAYDITAQETITVTVPVTALVTGAGAITGAPTLTVDSIVALGVYNPFRPQMRGGFGAMTGGMSA